LSQAEPVTSDLVFREGIAIGGQRWEVVCNPAPGKFEIENRVSWLILAGGLAFTTLLTTYLVTLVGRARQVRQEVDVRTSQLWEAVRDLNREVAERKAAEQELQRLNEMQEQHIARRTADAERKAQYLEQFAYVTSHDLKAPLRAVSNLAEWIEEDLADKLEDTSREQLALLRDRVQRMHNLIEGLLEYSRVGMISDSASYVDTRELIEEIIDSLSPPKGFKIIMKGEMPRIYVDRLQLGQVFSNLIGNSLKHHGGSKGKIWIAAECDDNKCRFSVCDNGQGIAPEYHDKVFMIFQALAASDFKSSTGIGLALVKKIVEENGGTITLESEPGKGACFYFTWPKRLPAE
jgi:signal transduction histidine kinase